MLNAKRIENEPYLLDLSIFLKNNDLLIKTTWPEYFESFNSFMMEDYNSPHKIKGTTLLSVFNEKHRITITPQMINKLLSWTIYFENLHQNSEALNTPYVGVQLMYFYDQYQDEIFRIFDTERKAFASSIVTIETVDLSRNVASDPFNLFIVWISHILMNTQMNHNLKEMGLITLYKLMHYRFFTSLVKQRFRYKADLNIMRAVVEGLSRKFDIVNLGTWKRAMEERSKDIVSEKSIHIDTIRNFKIDDKVFYVISDTQTRLRDKLNLIAERYYDLHKQKKEIGTYETVSLVNGEKVIKDTSNSLANMISNLSQNILSTNSFIDNESIKLLCNMNSELKPHMLRDLISRFIDISVHQSKKRQLDDIKIIKGEEYLIGHRKLIEEIIQVTYRNCINSGINMKNKYEILKTTGNIYRSSQIKDDGVLRVKRSVEMIINNFPGTKRYTTQLALRINFILYVILLSFKYL